LGPSAGVERGFEVRGGVPFSGGLNWVDILKGIGWSVTAGASPELPMLTGVGEGWAGWCTSVGKRERHARV
jgi:hypothetical protein